MGNGVSEEEKQKIYALQSSHQQLQAQHNILQQQLRSCQQLVREKDYQLRTFEDTCNQQKQQIEQSQLQTQRMNEEYQKQLSSTLNLFQEEIEKKNQILEFNFKEKIDLIRANEKLENDLLMMRVDSNSALSKNDFSNEASPERVRELFGHTKEKLRSLVDYFEDECQISEDKSFELEKDLSKYLFKEVKSILLETSDQAQVSAEKRNEELDGSTEFDTKSKMLIIKQGILKIISEYEQDSTLIKEEVIEELCKETTELFRTMQACSKTLEFIWYDSLSEYNPYEQSSINNNFKILVEYTIFPCLMIPSTRTVFERALVGVKEKKSK
ncbi:hypothetical protein FDP41_002253 [Naegleria fowleri]|uniref:Uncharacterized protein n=1 Tax=Naegleria fowleri TaxID=5763 RepID=A0A6A5BKB0_NAEFO|nr:uncharacterized protein FDP41_002253 [Naegleria fowleri]KAF0978433.1 hypothetical protein FDP41_002253 [Naegleria fowleri]